MNKEEMTRVEEQGTGFEAKRLAHIKDKWYEVQQQKELYELYRDKVTEMGNDIQERPFWQDVIGQNAQTMNIHYYQYLQAFRDLSQLCHILGGEYLELFNSLADADDTISK